MESKVGSSFCCGLETTKAPKAVSSPGERSWPLATKSAGVSGPKEPRPRQARQERQLIGSGGAIKTGE